VTVPTLIALIIAGVGVSCALLTFFSLKSRLQDLETTLKTLKGVGGGGYAPVGGGAPPSAPPASQPLAASGGGASGSMLSPGAQADVKALEAQLSA